MAKQSTAVCTGKVGGTISCRIVSCTSCKSENNYTNSSGGGGGIMEEELKVVVALRGTIQLLPAPREGMRPLYKILQ